MRAKSDDRRQSIIKIAAEVFQEMGYEGAPMAEICRRVGGSRSTVYSYFPSKEALLVEVLFESNEKQVAAIHDALNHSTEQISEALQYFGEGLLALLYSPNILAVRRLVVSGFGYEELGRTCYELGPKRSMDELSEFLLAAIKNGKLREFDPQVATRHLRGLLESELMDVLLFQLQCDITPEKISQVTARAIKVFMAAYGPNA